MRALRYFLAQLELEKTVLKPDNESLKSTNEYLRVRVASSSNTKAKRYLESFVETILPVTWVQICQGKISWEIGPESRLPN